MKKVKKKKEKQANIATRFIEYITPTRKLSELPQAVVGQILLICIACCLIGIASIVTAITSKSFQPLYGIVLAIAIFIYAIWSHFAAFLYDRQMILTGRVVKLPDFQDAKSISGKIAIEYKRIFLTIQTDDGMYYKIPCSPSMASVEIGDIVRVYCENNNTTKLSDTSLQTSNATLIELIEEHVEEQSENE